MKVLWMSCCSWKTLVPNLITWSKVQTWYWNFLFCPKCWEILEGDGSIGAVGILLVGDRSGIIPAVHVLDNVFIPECDISVTCKGKKDFLCLPKLWKKWASNRKWMSICAKCLEEILQRYFTAVIFAVKYLL